MYIACVVLQAGITLAQSQEQAAGTAVAGAAMNSGVLPVGIGATFIEGQPFYLINFEPDVSFGNFGVGLDINLRFDSDGKLREDTSKLLNTFSKYPEIDPLCSMGT